MNSLNRFGRKSTAKWLLLSGLSMLTFASPALAQGDPEITVLGFTHAADSNTGHVYYLTGLKGSWTEMEARAQTIGAHLVAVNSAAENDLITSHLTGLGSSELAWIGLRQTSNSDEPYGNWAWSNGDPFVYGNASYYQHFCSAQPDNYLGGQDYACIHSDVALGGDCWDDAHNSVVPGGGWPNNSFQGIVEVVPCSSSTLTATVTKSNIPFGNTGNDPDIWLGYGPQTVTLTAVPSILSSLNFSWTSQNSANLSLLSCTNCANPTFTPTVPGNYKFTVFISSPTAGCMVRVSTTVRVIDIRDPNDRTKVIICHQGHTQSVAVSSVASPHLSQHNDQLGPCPGGASRRMVETHETTEINIYPNPAQNTFVVEIPHSEEAATIVIRDIQGKVVEARKVNENENHQVRFDMQDNPRGLYFIEGTIGGESFHNKIVLQ